MTYYSSQLIRLVDLVYIFPSVYYIIKKIRGFALLYHNYTVKFLIVMIKICMYLHTDI